MSAEVDAAVKALADAEAALAAVEKAEVVVPVVKSEKADVVAGVGVRLDAVHAQHVDLGPEYLGPVAVNGG